jgi:hypothetical protein
VTDVVEVVAYLEPSLLEGRLPMLEKEASLPGDTWMVSLAVGISDECRLGAELTE